MSLLVKLVAIAMLVDYYYNSLIRLPYKNTGKLVDGGNLPHFFVSFPL